MRSRVKKRLVVGLFDFLFVAVAASSVLLVCAPAAHAYVDPSVMTYTIQALAGVAVALSAVFSVLWRRIRHVLFKVLGIDENYGKVLEEPVVRFSDEEQERKRQAEQAQESARGLSKRVASSRVESLPWRSRLLISAVVAFGCVFLLAWENGLELIASNNLLSFGVADVWLPVTVFSLVLFVVLTLVLSAFKGRAFNFALALVCALTLAAFLQMLLLNNDLPVADGTAVNWGDYTRITLVSSVVWLAVFVCCIVLAQKKSLAFKGFASLVAVIIVCTQALSFGLTVSKPADDGSSLLQKKPMVSMEGIMDVSTKGNTVVFVLDTFDADNMNQVLEEYPDALDEMTGFTYYPNSVGNMIPTRFAMASLINGKRLSYDDPEFSNDLIRRWYSEEGLLDDINAQGYSVGVYSEEIGNGLTALSQKTVNVHENDASSSNFFGTILAVEKCSFYRFMPWIAKAPFWFYTDELSSKIFPTSDGDLSNQHYTCDDAAYYQNLCSDGLVINDEAKNGTFKFIHLMGAHAPYTLDENAQVVGEGESSLIKQCRGSLTIVSEYLQQMKELGVYDDSTIIITADHGYWQFYEDMTGPTCPLLLVKPAGADNVAYTVSNVPTGHMDLSATIIDSIGGDASEYGTPIYEVTDEDRTRYYDATEGGYTGIVEWEINGEALNYDNWSLTGHTWPDPD